MIKLNNKIYVDKNVSELTNIKEVAFMSIDSSKSIDFDKKCIPFLNEELINSKSNTNINILSGYDDQYQPVDSEKDKDYILHCLINEKMKNKAEIPMEFLSYRGTLTKIASFPYENRENLLLSAIKYKGTIFLWWYNSNTNESRPEEFRKAIYSGYRFEKLITTNVDDDNDALFNNNQFISMVSSKLESKNVCHNLVYAGEVDCLKKSTNKYIEIKSRFRKSKGLDYALKRFQFLKYWLQSYLIGIDTVVVGYRNTDFLVEEIVEYDINFFYRAARNSNPQYDLWKPNVCMNFLSNFLTEIQNVMQDFSETDICIINFNVNDKDVKFTKTNQIDDEKFDFLPTWFREKF